MKDHNECPAEGCCIVGPDELCPKLQPQRNLQRELEIAQENFRVTNRAYVQLDIELRQRSGLIGFLVRRWVKRQLRLSLTTQEKYL